MIYNTYTLFDTDGSGTLYPNDLQNVAQLFGISALSGNKAKEVFDTYDTNGQGGIDQEEYALFVHDPSLPGVMSTVLRTYSKTLAEIGGRMSGARMRDEVAIEVAGYLEVVSSKNITRLSWVSQALTNGSLPIQFTADVLRELAVAVDDPNRLSVVDVGAVVFGEMMRLNSEWLVKAVRLLSEPQFWLSEGFPGPEEAGVVSRLVNWTATTPLGPWALKQGGMDFRDSASNGESLAKAAYRVIQGRQSHYAAGHLVDKASGEATVYSSSASQYMRSQLLGGSGAAASGDNLEADMATRAGVPALPATLQFAHWLANNATLTAQQHLQECFDYSGESSGTLDSLAVQVNGMFSKVQGFMNQMSSYATSQGVERLVNQSLSFLKGAADDIVLVCEEYVDAQLAEINCQLSGVVCNMTAREKDMSLDLTGSFNFITMTLQDLKTVMPAVLKDLKFAKKGVSSVSNSMNSVMVVLGLKAPPFMYQISLLYRRLWVAYFVVFGLMTLGVLFYAFWASGYFGGPQTQTSSAGEDGGYEAPRGFAERLRSCCTSCTACVRGCHDNHLCFWSLLLLAEVVVLLLFLVSVVICIIGGVQAFLSVGCAQVYILGNESICTTALKVMRTFLSTFWMQSSSVQDTCVQESLLTCQLMTNHMNAVVKLSVFGSLLASVLSFWMVLESALMHERARWSRVVDAQAKKP